jgi:hypothetical protein
MKRLGATVLLLAVLVTACGRLGEAGSTDVSQSSTRQEMTEVAPYPADIRESGWDSLLATIKARVADWETRVDPSSMTTAEVVSGIEMIFAAIHNRESHPDEMPVLRELFGRAQVLCRHLPADHPASDEYC